MTTRENSLTQEQTNDHQYSDSKTKVHPTAHGGRVTMTIRILPNIKKAFADRTRQLGLSTCHVAEGLFTGFLNGTEANWDQVHKGPTINMTLVRDVKRVRRFSNIQQSTNTLVEEELGDVKACVVCGKNAFARAIDGEGYRFLCRTHFDKVKVRLLGWKVLA